MSPLVIVLLVTSYRPVVSQYIYDTKYVDVNVDHFNFDNTDTFKLRYLENNSYWKAASGAPIFFYTGNEADITLLADNTGFMWELAPQFKALVVFAEHRYYGISQPYGNESSVDLKHFQYLSSSQALLDFIYVLDDIRSRYKITKKSNPVILIGGSYSGMLAFWLRLKFPDQAIGALASSAPIWMFPGMTPCESFIDVTSSTFKRQSQKCFDNIKRSWGIIDNMASQAEGIQWISDNFKPCKPLRSQDDVSKLKNWLEQTWIGLAQFDYPYRTNLISDLPAHPVKVACQSLNNKINDDQDLIMKIVKSSSVYFNYSGQASCLDVEAAEGNYNSLWDIQMCTEMVMPLCSSTSSMFQPAKWNFSSYSNECYDHYKVRPRPYLAEKLYGGKDIQHSTSNIIFSNGLLDPWSSKGVLSDISKSVVAVVMPDAAHHLDLRASNPADPSSVKNARAYYRTVFRNWINSYRGHNNKLPFLSGINFDDNQ